MSRIQWAIGGVLAVGLVGLTASAASAQFAYGGVPTYGGTYVTPYGGVVNRTVTYSPFTNTTVVNKTYVSPYAGYGVGRTYYTPGLVGPVYGGPGFRPAFGYPAYGYAPGYGVGGLGYSRGGLSFGISFGRTFW